MTPFTYVCLHTLLDHHGDGIIDAHPNYIEENMARFSAPGFTDDDAWNALDYKNHEIALMWMHRWDIPYGKYGEAYQEEMEALKSLRAKGINF